MILIALFTFASSQIICLDSNNLTTQMEPSIVIPNYSCSLNVSQEILINMTSQQGQLQIVGSTLLLQTTIQFTGFLLIEFSNITIDTQTYSIISDSKILLTNTTLTNNCNYAAEQIIIKNCVITQAIFQSRTVFSSQLKITSLIISESAFFHSALCDQRYDMKNITLSNVHLINSTLGSVNQINKLTILNSYIASSDLFHCNIVQEIFVNNTFLILSTIFHTSGSLYVIIQNVIVSQSMLFVMQNDNQIQLKNIYLNNITSDSELITTNSPYVNVSEFHTTNLSVTTIFKVVCKNMFIHESSFINLTGSIIVSNNSQEMKLMFNILDIQGSQSNQLIDIKGKLSMKTGTFQSNNCSLISSKHNLIEFSIDSFLFSDLDQILVIAIQGANLAQFSHLTIQDCDEMIFAQLTTVINVNMNNISLKQCGECNFLYLNSTNTLVKDVQIRDIQNFIGNLIFVANSDMVMKRVNLSNIVSKAQTLIKFQDNLIILLTSLDFTDIYCSSCQGIMVIDNAVSVSLYKSIFSNSITDMGFVKVGMTNFTAYNNIVKNVSSHYGSAFYIMNSTIKLYNNSFSGLFAGKQGGVIYYKQEQNNIYYIQENQVANCTAEQGNYIYIMTQQISIQDEDYFIEGPVFIQIMNYIYSLDQIIRKQTQIYFREYKSGQKLNFSLSIFGSGQQKLCNFENDLIITNQSYHFDNQRCEYQIETVYFQNFPKKEEIQLQFQLLDLELYHEPFTFSVQLQFVECSIGEQWVNNACQLCESGTYSLDSYSACLQCIPQAKQCPGGAIINLKQGYWRYDNLTDHTESCSSERSLCLGGTNSFTCGSGYVGALCEDCDYYGVNWDKAFVRDINNQCIECNLNIMMIFKVLFGFFWIGMVLYFSVSGALRMAKAQLIGHYLRLIGWHFGSRSTMKIDETDVLFKMVSTYFQLLSILIVLSMQLPQPFHTLSQIIGNPLQTFGFQIECLLLKSGFAIEMMYLRQIWNLIISVIFVSTFVFCYFIQSVCRNLENSISTIFINTMIQVHFFFSGDLIEGLFEILFCIEASGQVYVQASTSNKCYTEQHLTYIKAFIVPVLFLVGIINPLFYFIKLYRNKTKLWTCQIRLPYGYLFMEYKIYYWELLRFTIKFSFSILSTLLVQDIKLLFMFAILILLIYQEFLNKAQPYFESKYNVLDKISTQLEIINLVLVYIQYDNSNQWIVYIVRFLISVLNLIFIIYFIFKIAFELCIEYKKALLEKLITLLDRFPWLQKCINKPKPLSMPTRINYLWKKARQHVFSLINEQRKAKSTIQSSFTRYLSNSQSQIKEQDIDVASSMENSTINESLFHSKLSECINQSQQLKQPQTITSIHRIVQIEQIKSKRKIIKKQI